MKIPTSVVSDHHRLMREYAEPGVRFRSYFAIGASAEIDVPQDGDDAGD